MSYSSSSSESDSDPLRTAAHWSSPGYKAPFSCKKLCACGVVKRRLSFMSDFPSASHLACSLPTPLVLFTKSSANFHDNAKPGFHHTGPGSSSQSGCQFLRLSKLLKKLPFQTLVPVRLKLRDCKAEGILLRNASKPTSLIFLQPENSNATASMLCGRLDASRSILASPMLAPCISKLNLQRCGGRLFTTYSISSSPASVKPAKFSFMSVRERSAEIALASPVRTGDAVESALRKNVRAKRLRSLVLTST
mmetsp:Transcript_68436/g.177747  ORF Transcript_68436/g.177747 Transcript_68436/m.177747 type:complete len:250 (-) Transcript_68436:663-1412(-)